MTTLMKEALGLFGEPPPHMPEYYSKSTGNSVRRRVLKNPFPGRCKYLPPTEGPNEKLNYISPKVTLGS